MEELNNTIRQQNLIDIYWTLYTTTAEYTFFASTCETYNKVNHIPSHKTNGNKFKRTEIIQSVFFDNSRIKLEISSIKIAGKSQNT